MTHARVVIVLRLYLLEQCLDPVFRTLIKTHNFVTFYEFLIHLGMHHTHCKVLIYHKPDKCYGLEANKDKRLVRWKLVKEKTA